MTELKHCQLVHLGGFCFFFLCFNFWINIFVKEFPTVMNWVGDGPKLSLVSKNIVSKELELGSGFICSIQIMLIFL